MNLDDIKRRLLTRVNYRNIDSVNLIIKVLDFITVCPHLTIIAEYLNIPLRLLTFKLNYYLTEEERKFVQDTIRELKDQEREKYFELLDNYIQ